MAKRSFEGAFGRSTKEVLDRALALVVKNIEREAEATVYEKKRRLWSDYLERYGATPVRPVAGPLDEYLGGFEDVLDTLVERSGVDPAIFISRYVGSTPGMSGRPDYYLKASLLWLAACKAKFKRYSPGNPLYIPPFLHLVRIAFPALQPLVAPRTDADVEELFHAIRRALEEEAVAAERAYLEVLSDASDPEPATDAGKYIRLKDKYDPTEAHRRYLAIVESLALHRWLPPAMEHAHRRRNIIQSIYTLCLAATTAAHAFYHSSIDMLYRYEGHRGGHPIECIFEVPQADGDEDAFTANPIVNEFLSAHPVASPHHASHAWGNAQTYDGRMLLDRTTIGETNERFYKRVDRILGDRMPLRWTIPEAERPVVPLRVRSEMYYVKPDDDSSDDDEDKDEIYSVELAGNVELAFYYLGDYAGNVLLSALSSRSDVRTTMPSHYGILRVHPANIWPNPRAPTRRPMLEFAIHGPTSTLRRIEIKLADTSSDVVVFGWEYMDVWAALAHNYSGEIQEPLPDAVTARALTNDIAELYTSSQRRRDFVRKVLGPYLERPELRTGHPKTGDFTMQDIFSARYAALASEEGALDADAFVVLRFADWLEPRGRITAAHTIETSYDDPTRSPGMFKTPVST